MVTRHKAFGGIWVVFMVMGIASTVEAGEVPFTQEDRERLIRLEEGLKASNLRFEEGLKAVDKRIDDVRDEIRDLKTFMLWGFGILFGGMGLLMGFVIWDRRTTLAPVARKTRELEEREELLEKAFKEYAKVEPRLAEILRSLRLM